MTLTDNTETKTNATKQRLCQYCGHQLRVVWVHGHGQCDVCKVNVDECCRGEVCEFDNNETNNQLKK